MDSDNINPELSCSSKSTITPEGPTPNRNVEGELIVENIPTTPPTELVAELPPVLHRRRTFQEIDEGFVEDEEWCSPVTKILKLPFDHESWQHADELLEPPSPKSRKVADEV